VSVVRGTVFGIFEGFVSRLRFPYLFWLTLVLFVLDLLIPDLLPFADEVLLALATLLLGSWKKRKQVARGKGGPGDDGGEGDGPVIDVEPRV